MPVCIFLEYRSVGCKVKREKGTECEGKRYGVRGKKVRSAREKGTECGLYTPTHARYPAHSCVGSALLSGGHHAAAAF
jgi:hypothetical protein